MTNDADANSPRNTPLAGLSIATFETRLRSETQRMLERQGGTVISAPAIKEIPHADQSAALQFGERLFRGEVDVLVLLTGVGTRLLIEVLAGRWPQQQVLDAIGRTLIVCRGPKPVGALKAFRLKPAIVVPEPNTWRDIVASFRSQDITKTQRIVIQEYGRSNPELVAALAAGGRSVETVALYGWALPDDLEPLRGAIAAIVSGGVQIVCFTTGVQADHLLEVADTIGQGDALRDALRHRSVVASIGPMTTERLQRNGVKVDIEPEHPKLGHLVLAIADHAPTALRSKASGVRSF